MFVALAAIATAAAGYFLSGSGGGGGLIPENINVTVDFWEKNKTLFILFFILIAALIISRL